MRGGRVLSRSAGVGTSTAKPACWSSRRCLRSAPGLVRCESENSASVKSHWPPTICNPVTARGRIPSARSFSGGGEKRDPWSWIASKELRDAWVALKGADGDAAVVSTWRNNRYAPMVRLLRPGVASEGGARKVLVDVFTQSHFCVAKEEASWLYTAPKGEIPMEPVGLWTFSWEDASFT